MTRAPGHQLASVKAPWRRRYPLRASLGSAVLVGAAACGGVPASQLELSPVPLGPSAGAVGEISVVLHDQSPGTVRNIYKPGGDVVESALRKVLDSAVVEPGTRGRARYALGVTIEHALSFLGTAFDPMFLTVRTSVRMTVPGQDLPIWGDVYYGAAKLKGRLPQVTALAGGAFRYTLQGIAEGAGRVDLQDTGHVGPHSPATSPVRDLGAFYALAERLFGFSADAVEVFAWHATVPRQLVQIATDFLPHATQVSVRDVAGGWERSNSPLYAGVSRLPAFSPALFQCSSPLHRELVYMPRFQSQLPPAEQVPLREYATVESARLSGYVFARMLQARDQYGALVYERSGGRPVPTTKLAPAEAGTPEDILGVLLQPPADQPPAGELLIDGAGLCMSLHAVGHHDLLLANGPAASTGRHHYSASFAGQASLRPYAAHLAGSSGGSAVDSLRLYAIGPAQEVDSAAVVRWLGQPHARSQESAETLWWRYADDVVGGQRRIGELRIVRGRLNALRVLITAE